jgi:hypothetical protein
MKVSIVRGGGVGGMATRTLLESAALPEPDAQALSSHVQAALGGGDAPAPAAASPDDLLYEIAVDDAGNQVTRRYTESSLPEPVRQLVEWVDGRPERSFSLER